MNLEGIEEAREEAGQRPVRPEYNSGQLGYNKAETRKSNTVVVYVKKLLRRNRGQQMRGYSCQCNCNNDN